MMYALVLLMPFTLAAKISANYEYDQEGLVGSYCTEIEYEGDSMCTMAFDSMTASGAFTSGGCTSTDTCVDELVLTPFDTSAYSAMGCTTVNYNVYCTGDLVPSTGGGDSTTGGDGDSTTGDDTTGGEGDDTTGGETGDDTTGDDTTGGEGDSTAGEGEADTTTTTTEAAGNSDSSTVNKSCMFAFMLSAFLLLK